VATFNRAQRSAHTDPAVGADMITTQRAASRRQQLLELVRHAVLAPSGHNTQPWRFALREHAVEVRPDFTRRLPAVDADDHALFISLGAAVENLRIAALAHALHSDIEYFPAATPDAIVVHLAPAARSRVTDLTHALPERQSTRSRYDGRPVPAADLRRLHAAAHEHGIRFRAFTDAADLAALTEMVREGNRIQVQDGAFVAELMDWIRFSRAEVRRHRDGLAAPVMGMPHAPRWLGRVIMRAALTPEAQARRAAQMVRSSAGLLLFVAEHHDPTHWVRLGQAFERVALTATSRAIRHAHVNMPCEVESVRADLAGWLGLPAGEQPLLLLRFGYGPAMPRSPRRPLADVLDT
jgi:hypothetical protein